MAKILIIDDEALVRGSLRDVLKDEGHEVWAEESFQRALPHLHGQMVDAVLLDVWLGNEDGLELLPQVLKSPSSPEVVMISGHGPIESAVRATKKGAYDFLEKPVSIDRLLLTLKHALDTRVLRLENSSLKRRATKTQLVGDAPEIQKLRQSVSHIARTGSSVLVTGENDAGKEIVARLIHEESTREPYPFIAVNCAAIPETLIESELFGYEKGAFTGAQQARKGKIESAHLGTLFLDEIADLSLQAQAKPLRVLQEKKISRLGSSKEIQVDVRWIAATNKDLTQLVRTNAFREDLLYRLNVIHLNIPPLRERGDDTTLLARDLIPSLCYELGIPLKFLSSRALDKLRAYSWPGNVRELKNVLERAVVMAQSDELTESDIVLKDASPGSQDIKARNAVQCLELTDFREARNAFEKFFLKNHLDKSEQNVSRLAGEIGLERTYLYKKLRQHQLLGEDA